MSLPHLPAGRAGDLRRRRDGGIARRRIGRLLGVLLVATLGAACGAGSAAPATTRLADSAKSTGSSAEAGDSVRVGAVVSLTGRFSREGLLLRDGYETWTRAANEPGGLDVGGTRRPVRLVVYDDESEPLVAARTIDKLVRQDGISLVLGPYSAPMTIAAATAAERLGALVVAPDASAGPIFARGLQMFVSVLPTEDRYFEGLIALAERVGPMPRSIALLVPDEPFFVAVAQGAVERAAGRGLVSSVERVPADARDVSGPLARLAQRRPSLLAVAGQPEQLDQFLPQLREVGPASTLRAAAPGPPLRDLPAGMRGAADGLLTVDWWSPDLQASGPVLGSAGEFAARFQRDHGYPPDARAASAAAAGLALQLGVERARAAEARSVRSAFAGLEATTFWGRLAWDAAGRNRGASVPVFQLAGGRARVVWPEPFTEEPLRLPAGGR